MPLYEYECDACHHRFEVIQKFSDPPIVSCPSCGGSVRKLLSSPAIQFKGSGWYITDYARKSGANGSAKAETEKAAEKDKPAETDKAGAKAATTGDSAKSRASSGGPSSSTGSDAS